MLAIAITPDAEYALSSGLDFILRKWDLRSGECSHTWEAGGPLNAILVSPSGEWALLGAVQGVVQWNMQSWQPTRSFWTYKAAIDDVAYVDELGMVLGAGNDTLIHRWDLETGEDYNPLVEHQHPVSALSVGNNSDHLLSADSSGYLRLWDLSTGECLLIWQGHERKITDLALLPHSRRVISVSQGKLIKIWDLRSGQQLQVLSGHTGWINALAVSEQENWMLSGGEDGLRIWDLESNQNVHSENSVDISCLTLSPNEQSAISGGRDGHLSLWTIT